MALTTTLNNGYELQKLFEECGRSDSFSNLGFDALFNYLDNLSEEIGEDLNIDVVAISCDYTEYDNFEEIAEDYFNSYGEEVNEDNMEDFKQWLNNNTEVIQVILQGNLYSVIIRVF